MGTREQWKPTKWPLRSYSSCPGGSMEYLKKMADWAFYSGDSKFHALFKRGEDGDNLETIMNLLGETWTEIQRIEAHRQPLPPGDRRTPTRMFSIEQLEANAHGGLHLTIRDLLEAQRLSAS